MTGIRVLGPIEVEVNGRLVDLGGPRQRAVLAMLVAARRGVVSTDRLIEDLWRGAPPPSATASLQAYVSKLRRVLESSRSLRTPARLPVSAPPGYALRVADEQVDAWRFEGLLRQARELGGPGAADARVVLEEALGLWQGPAFAEVVDEPWAATEAARLEQLRLGAAELLVEAMLGTGAAAEGWRRLRCWSVSSRCGRRVAVVGPGVVGQRPPGRCVGGASAGPRAAGRGVGPGPGAEAGGVGGCHPRPADGGAGRGGEPSPRPRPRRARPAGGRPRGRDRPAG